VLRTRLCIFDVNQFAEGIPQVKDVGDDHAFPYCDAILCVMRVAPMHRLMREICASTRA
jgi:hypothetical protein